MIIEHGSLALVVMMWTAVVWAAGGTIYKAMKISSKVFERNNLKHRLFGAECEITSLKGTIERMVKAGMKRQKKQ